MRVDSKSVVPPPFSLKQRLILANISGFFLGIAISCCTIAVFMYAKGIDCLFTCR